MIYLLWPTVRPQTMIERHKQWLEAAQNPENVEVRVAVNTQEQAEVLKENGYQHVLVCGDELKGVAPPSYALSSKLTVQSADIIVLASDDFFAPPKWDTWLCQQFNEYSGCILVNDGYQYGGCVTIPIMSQRCLKRLNNIIYHPSYLHLWSDAELYDNLKKLNLLKDLRKKKDAPIFEHRHWANGKRKFDAADQKSHNSAHTANQVYNSRQKLPLKERFKVGDKWVAYVKNSYWA